MKILFVCTGNTCRSPMAEAILKNRKPGLDVESRGIAVRQGSRTSRQTRQALKVKLDLDWDRPARQIRERDCREADYILTMTQSQADFLRNLGCCDSVFTLREFIGESGDVPDPFGCDQPVYDELFDRMEEFLQRVLIRLEQEKKTE